MTDPMAEPKVECRDTKTPTCPACKHAMTLQEMQKADPDLWGMAHDDDQTWITCPSCNTQYFCKGTWVPQYTSALQEIDL